MFDLRTCATSRTASNCYAVWLQTRAVQNFASSVLVNARRETAGSKPTDASKDVTCAASAIVTNTATRAAPNMCNSTKDFTAEARDGKLH